MLTEDVFCVIQVGQEGESDKSCYRGAVEEVSASKRLGKCPTQVTHKMPSPSNTTTVALACFVILTFHIIGIGSRAYSQSVMIVITLSA